MINKHFSNLIMQVVTTTCITVLVLTTKAHSQPDTLWTNSVRNAGHDLQVICTADNGYVVGTHGWAGDEDRGDADFQLMKLDSLGNLEWRQFYPGIYNNGHGSDVGLTVSETPDGGYVLGGIRHGCVLIRTDDVGDTLWMRYYRDDGFPSPSMGSMRCTITTDDEIIFNTKNVIVKVNDEDGSVIWRQEFDDATDISSILHAENGGYFITGWTNEFGAGSNDTYAAEIDADGELIWQEAYGFENSDVSSRSLLMSNGAICIIGSARYGNGSYDTHPYIVQINSEGNLIWEHIYEEVRGVSVRDLVETSDGGFAVACHSSYYGLWRFDYFGEFLWRTSFGYHGWNPTISGEAYSVLLMEDGGYLLGGFSELGCWLVRTEPDTVVLPFELETEADYYDFGELDVDSTSVWEFEIYNTGRRYAVIDTVWFEGSNTAAFTCPLELPLRINPKDTCLVPVLFSPSADTSYAAVLIIPYGDRQALRVLLDGNGYVNSVSDEPNVLHEFALYEAYPNPFNSTTTITYGLDKSAPTRLALYDLSGREVMTLFEGYRQSGFYSVILNAGELSSGLYFLRMDASNRIFTNKVILIR
ncbi:T9SS type A sorting domain-containing protein [bacterium]|nr:T9SS type A sorting domain-containing protein [bacterium]